MTNSVNGSTRREGAKEGARTSPVSRPARTVEERNRLVIDNLSLAGAAALRFAARHPHVLHRIEVADLEQAAVVGLYLAVSHFDPARGALSTLAWVAMRQQMWAALRASEFIHIPVYLRGRRRAEARAQTHTVSLQGCSAASGDGPRDDGPPAPEPQTDSDPYVLSALRDAIGALPRQLRDVVTAYHFRGRTLGEVGAQMGFSRQYACELLARGERALRRALGAPPLPRGAARRPHNGGRRVGPVALCPSL